MCGHVVDGDVDGGQYGGVYAGAARSAVVVLRF